MAHRSRRRLGLLTAAILLNTALTPSQAQTPTPPKADRSAPAVSGDPRDPGGSAPPGAEPAAPELPVASAPSPQAAPSRKAPLPALTLEPPLPTPAPPPRAVVRTEKACGKEIRARCSGFSWGRGLATCLKHNERGLGNECRRQVRALEARHERFQDVRDECRPDVHRVCRSVVPGQGRVLGCLKANEARVSETCQNRLKDLGTPPVG